MGSRTLKTVLTIVAAAAMPLTAHAANIVETAKTDGHFTMLLSAGEKAGVANWLKSSGPITVFAPNDDALGKGVLLTVSLWILFAAREETRQR